MLAVAGRPDRIGRDEQRVAVAVGRERHAGAGRCPTSRPCATGDRGNGNGNGPRPRRRWPPRPRRPCTRPSAPARRSPPGPRPGRGRRGRTGCAARRRPGQRRGPAGHVTASRIAHSDREAGRGHGVLDRRDRVDAAVEDRGGQDGIGTAVARRRRRSAPASAAPPDAMTGHVDALGDRHAAGPCRSRSPCRRGRSRSPAARRRPARPPAPPTRPRRGRWPRVRP